MNEQNSLIETVGQTQGTYDNVMNVVGELGGLGAVAVLLLAAVVAYFAFAN